MLGDKSQCPWQKDELNAAWRDMQGVFNDLKASIQSQVFPYQMGGKFTVPEGFPNDTFVHPMALSSGETVEVTPSDEEGERQPTIYIENINVTNENMADQLIDELDRMGVRLTARA